MVLEVLDLPELKTAKPSATCWLAHDYSVKVVKLRSGSIVTALRDIHNNSHEPDVLGLSKALGKQPGSCSTMFFQESFSGSIEHNTPDRTSRVAEKISNFYFRSNFPSIAEGYGCPSLRRESMKEAAEVVDNDNLAHETRAIIKEIVGRRFRESEGMLTTKAFM